MRNKVLVLAVAISLGAAGSASARDGCDSCLAFVGGAILGNIIANSNSHPRQPEYTPPLSYYNRAEVPEYNPAAPRGYYYNQDNTPPPPPLPQELQDQYRLQYGHQPEYRLVYPQQPYYAQQPRRPY